MSFLLDECTPKLYLDLLIAWGYTASRSVDALTAGESDEVVAKAASDQDAVILTVDKDFLNVVQFPPE